MEQSQSQKFVMPSGAVLSVTTAPFADAWALTKATLKSLKGVALSREDLGRDFAALGDAATAVPAIFDRIISFVTSDEVEGAVFKCAARALYAPAGSPEDFPGLRVERGLFDDPKYGNQAREDYAQIIVRVLEVNCKPFLAKALSGLWAPARAAASGTESQPSRMS